MATNKHLYLKNEKGSNDGFKKTRNVQQDNSQEDNQDNFKYPIASNQDRLRRAHVIFYRDK